MCPRLYGPPSSTSGKNAAAQEGAFKRVIAMIAATAEPGHLSGGK